jgi:glycogen debranching enzyme
MDIQRQREALEAIIPGVVEAYDALKNTKSGMYTSNGEFYNHTFFGRDTAMSAKFVADFDHDVPRTVIHALVAMQGTRTNHKTQEEAGRIHHEYRDFREWHGTFLERVVLGFYKRRWGVQKDQLLTYFSTDTTALYIRLVAKFAKHIDKSILETTVTNRRGKPVVVSDSVAKAADWIVKQVDERGHIVAPRTNNWALPYQTFQDGATAYAREDGHLANFKKGITFLEGQAFNIDALEEASLLLEDHPHRHEWQAIAHKMRSCLLKDFWDENESFFGSAYDVSGLVSMPNLSAGWILNNSLWRELSEEQTSHFVTCIVTRLFTDDFLTPIGLRTRGLHTHQPLPGVVEYHGRLTVWPMFTFMVIEGLRRHRLYKLAEELENRLINGINASGSFEEFFVVDGGGHLLRSVTGKKATISVDAQMLPEENIAFTVVPAMTLARRATNRSRAWPQQQKWQADLEKSIIDTIDAVDLLDPKQAHSDMTAVVPTKFRRVRGTVRTGLYFMRERRKM